MAKTYRGTIYSFKNPPTRQFYQLKKNELLAMNLIGLPICIEHHDTPVGTVVAASMSEDSADVEWSLNENASGWAAETLVDKGAARELSLKHLRMPDGTLKPLEVSLVVKGARPDSSIHINTVAVPTLKQGEVAASSAMSAEAAPMATETPAPVAAAPVATEQPRNEQGQFTTLFPNDAAAAPAPAVTEQPVAKKMRLETGEDHLSFIKGLSDKIQDPAVMQMIVDYAAENLQQAVDTRGEMEKLNEAKKALEMAVESNKQGSKTVVSDIVTVLSQLYGKYSPTTKLDDVTKSEFINTMVQNPAALEMIKPIMIAASAIANEQVDKAKESKAQELNAAMSRIQQLTNQLGTKQKMNAPVNVQAAPTPMMPSWQMASPAVTVAASGASMQQMQQPTDEISMLRGMQLPPILQGLTAFQGQVRSLHQS